ncbi:MAG: low molecular weight phosphotyrosine protein phosphatase [Oscillospiraceae bacterium]|nr:low molecular weight phosphotyrosine protein phosphatase [Oscillospiraceae bacterium]
MCVTATLEIWNGIGNPVYPPAKVVLEGHGIDPSGKRAVQLKASDYDKYDLFIGMDSNNIRNMTRILSGDKRGKIHKLMECTGSNTDVSYPWYTRDFDRCYKDIYAGCEALLNSLL